MKFPDGFLWGAATASYQIEGAAREVGKGPSIWDQFCRKPGVIRDGYGGETACDHYHRFQEDIGLMKEIGLQAYRFSIAWPRVLPEGVGTPNPAGLDFYDRLVDLLLQQGIIPFVTLYHWDMPLQLYHQGGWLNPESPDWFAAYTGLVVKRLGDRVKHWITFNENKIFVAFGYSTGVHAPGVRLNLHDVLQINHNVLLAHGKGVQAIRMYGQAHSQVGMAAAVVPNIPVSDSAVDIEAARQANFAFRKDNLMTNGFWQDPAYRGDYDADFYRVWEEALPKIGPEDLQIIATPVDFIGLNIYHGQPVQAGKDGAPIEVELAQGHPRTAFNWPVMPESLYWGPRFFYERYGKPVLITENGLSNPDWVGLDGQVHDPQRIDFTRQYLRQLRQAITDGVKVNAYFHWSLMDNFEWAEGYTQRFGLIHVDYPTKRRTIKDSGYWYRQLIATHGENIDIS